jgi:peroxiredoxin Q/BCP
MTRTGILTIAGAVALCGFFVFLALQAGSRDPRAGEAAPLFEGRDQHGQTVRLAAFQGQSNVVLYFYPKDGTPGCTAQACSLRDGYAAIQAAGAVVIGVSADSARSHAEFASKHGLPFPILPDPEHTIIGKYGVGMPVIGISRRVTFIIGKDGVIRQVITNARTKDHDRQVLDALRELTQEG